MKKIGIWLFLLIFVPMMALGEGSVGTAGGVAQPGYVSQQEDVTLEGDEVALSDAPDVLDTPVYTEKGLLAEGYEPIVTQDHAAGYWLYADQDLKVEITRIQTESPKLTYYIADIICSENEYLRTISYNQDHPGRTNGTPETIAQTHRAIYAQSGDFYSYRVSNDNLVGIIIRDGKIIYKKTYSKAVLNVPDLSNLALYADGTLEVYPAYAMTAQEYVDRGAVDVLAFGPILIENGGINPDVYTNFTYKEPRNAIGTIEPGHYVGILVEGRVDHSDGCGLQFLAETLYSLGCTDAINLDGGGTSAMLFMGQSVQMSSDGSLRTSTRAIPDILAIGTY